MPKPEPASLPAELAALEAEALYVIREALLHFSRPVVLFSGGKDSLVLLFLIARAVAPASFPIPVMHVDTGHNFPETLSFRDELMQQLGAQLVIASVEESIRQGRVREEIGLGASRNGLQSVTLMDALQSGGYDCAFGGGRRDEEKARAKERFFSHRNSQGRWQPDAQVPEPWTQLIPEYQPGEQYRVFPLNNWTELDIWHYIRARDLPLPSLYFSHERAVFDRGGVTYADANFIAKAPEERVETRRVRFRTVGDMTCTGAIASQASTVADIITELQALRVSERGTRADDKRSETAMEDRKSQGYF